MFWRGSRVSGSRRLRWSADVPDGSFSVVMALVALRLIPRLSGAVLAQMKRVLNGEVAEIAEDADLVFGGAELEAVPD